MLIRPATERDLDSCFEIDTALSESRPAAQREGFLISGDQRGSYDAYLALNSFLVAEDEGRIAGFVFALPPETPHFLAVRANQEHFQLESKELWDQPHLAWLGKIAVRPEYMRRGIGRALYRELFERHPERCYLTTIVADPIPNAPAHIFHERLGFDEVGSIALGNRGSMKNVVCTVLFRPADGGGKR